MLEIYIAGQDYYTCFTEYPDTVLPVRWYKRGKSWATENRRMPKNTWKTTLEALPSDLQEHIQRYKGRWENLLPQKEE